MMQSFSTLQEAVRAAGGMPQPRFSLPVQSRLQPRLQLERDDGGRGFRLPLQEVGGTDLGMEMKQPMPAQQPMGDMQGQLGALFRGIGRGVAPSGVIPIPNALAYRTPGMGRFRLLSPKNMQQ